MLENIKSLFFLKLFFTYFESIKKLKIIKYNKKIQCLLDINIINYKIFSGRYIIYDSKNKGKEYDSYNDKLVYEGEYLNGEKSGKGKEYGKEIVNDGKLIFEGEYLNGKKNGKGKEYFNSGELQFEGEYLNGKRNGKGIEYYIGQIRFKGIYLDGNKRFGKSYFKHKIIFESEFINNNKFIRKGFSENILETELKKSDLFLYKGLIQGKECNYCDNDKIIFEGEYLNGKRWNGKLYDLQDDSIIYELKNGNGFIKEYNYINEELLFEGEFIDGEKNGKGKEYKYSSFLIFEGEYKNDKRNGKGKEYSDDGKLIFEGEYLNGKRNGKGKEYSINVFHNSYKNNN